MSATIASYTTRVNAYLEVLVALTDLTLLVTVAQIDTATL